VARKSKRRGDSRPSDAEPRRPGVATARAREQRIGSRVDDATDPIGHSAPDAELAEAQIAAGEERAEELADDGRGGGGSDGDRGRGGGGGDDSEELQPAGRAGPHPRHRNRAIAFVQGSWRELQRVQWPDQRQVVQATGVVIGFVIVAGAWLGLADWVATKIVNFIL
jgi:preprotein translocase SecE subunit